MSQFQPNNPAAPIQTAYAKTVQNCRSLIDAGQFDSAIGLLQNALKQSPKDVQVHRMLGHSLMMIDETKGAIHHLTFATKLDPRNPDLLCDLASALRRVDELGKAHKAVDEALKMAPHYPRAVTTKARLLQSHGQSQRAYELMDQVVQEHFDPALLGTYGQLCRELKHQSRGIDALRKGLAMPGIARNARQDILFVLGHLLDSVGEYDEAFDCFAKGNAMSPEPSHTDLEHHLERWKKEKYEQVPESIHDGSRAVFIVGMPRSGTTLTEQIIASHPQAGGVGESSMIDQMTRHHELTDFDQTYVDKAGAAYLAMLEKNFPNPSIKRVCDKMPENYFFAGFIKRILPGSHIIHCRRNPIDTCLSIFFQRFGPRLVYAMDLDFCAKQYLVYTKVIEHLTNELGVNMHDAVYEQTTADPEGSIRAMLDHIDLPFDQACMNFHKSKKSVHTASAAQIRQPLYTSSNERWRNYEKHIAPLIETLSPLIES
ncbi:MAG: tetratricopeptide repeat-containing sulfotransferase family protein [Phycisphaerales bacterium]